MQRLLTRFQVCIPYGRKEAIDQWYSEGKQQSRAAAQKPENKGKMGIVAEMSLINNVSGADRMGQCRVFRN